MEPRGRLELTWTNKHLRLLAHEDATYEWVEPGDYRVAEVRLLNDVTTVGEIGRGPRARDNLLIRGDALGALTSLLEIPEFRREYAGKVRLVYIDPPFNTGQAFEQYDDALEHSVWLTMLRDRLVQIRDLLAPNGSVWVHVDDAEAHRARCVLDEVFGFSCYVSTITWRASDNSNNDAKTLSNDTNFLLVYSARSGWTSNLEPADAERLPHYRNPTNDPLGPYFDGNPLNSPNPRDNLKYELLAPNGNRIHPPPNGWRWERDTLEARMDAGEIQWRPDFRGIFRRTYLRDHKGLPASNLWSDLSRTGHNRQAKYELRQLFPGVPTSRLFKTPKPERLVRRIIDVATDPNDIVLDCFLGSGTTAGVAQKMGRRWIGMEWDAQTVADFALPRLTKVVTAEDPGGITESVGWEGGGGFRVLDVAPSIFAADQGRVVLVDDLSPAVLAEATAAQLAFEFEMRGPFCGRKGRTRLTVLDGLANEGVVRLLVDALNEDERLTVCATAIDPAARDVLRDLRPGSTLRKIPQTILDEYRTGRAGALSELMERDGDALVPEAAETAAVEATP